MSDGSVVIDTSLNEDGLKSGLSSMTSTITKGVKVGAKAVTASVAAVGAGVAAVGKSAVSAFASYEQLVGGVDTLFKSSSKKVQKYADQAYKTAQLSANDYMETVTSFSASLLQGLKGDTDKAADKANKAIIDMSDNANKMGTDMKMIQNAYQGFAKQNYTMLDNLKLGYGGTKSEMARLVADSGVLGNAAKDLTAKNLDQKVSFDQIVDAIHIMQQRLGIAGTSAKEASTTIEGSVNSMKSSWQNLLVAMSTGKNFDEVFDQFIASVETVMKNLTPVISRTLDGVGKLVSSGLKEFVPMITSYLVKTFPKLLDSIIDIISTVGPKVLRSLQKLGSDMIAYATKIGPELVSFIDQMIPKVVSKLSEVLQTIVNNIPSILPYLLTTSVSLLKTLVSSIAKEIPGIFKSIKSSSTDIVTMLFGQNIGKSFSNMLSQIGKAGKSIWSSLGRILQTLWKYILNIYDALKPVISTVLDLASNVIPLIAEAFGLLANNMEIILPIISSVLAGFLAYKAISTVITIMSTLVAIIPTVKAALMGLWAVMSAHPIMAIITGIVTLTTAIAAFVATSSAESDTISSNFDKITEANARLTEELSKQKEEVQGLSDSYLSAKEQADSRVSQIDIETDRTRQYWAELKNITDENGNIKKGYEERAQYLTGELSSALGIEFDWDSKKITNLSEINSKMDKYIAQTRLKNTIDAKTSEYNEAKKNEVSLAVKLTEQRKLLTQAEENYKKAQQKVKEALDKKHEAEKAGMSQSEIESRTKQWEKALKAQGDAAQVYMDSKDAVQETEATYENMVTTISNYEQALNSVGKSTKKMNKASEDLATGLKKHGTVSDTVLKKQAENAVANYDKLYKAVKNGDANISKKQLNAAKKQASQALTEFGKAGKNIVRGFVNGLNEENRSNGLSSAVESMVKDALSAGNKAAKIKSPSKITTESGKFLGQGWVVGFKKAAPQTQIVTMVKQGMSTIQDAMNTELASNIKVSLDTGLGSLGDTMVDSLEKAGLSVQIGERQFGRIVRSVM